MKLFSCSCSVCARSLDKCVQSANEQGQSGYKQGSDCICFFKEVIL